MVVLLRADTLARGQCPARSSAAARVCSAWAGGSGTRQRFRMKLACPSGRRALICRAEDAGVGEQPTCSSSSPDDVPHVKAGAWPPPSSLYLFRTDGMSCSRELVTGSGKLRFSHPSTQQHLLVWRDRPRSVMVVKKLGHELTDEFLEVVRYLGEAERMHVVVEPGMYDVCRVALADPHTGAAPNYVYTFTAEERASGQLSDCVDFVACLGGDGVILHASTLFAGALPPVLSFHLGSMGFLTNHAFKGFKRDLREVIYGATALESCSLGSLDVGSSGNRLGVMVALRMRLECAVVRRGSGGVAEQVHQVLNEVVVDRGSSSFLTNIECYIGGRLITRVQADGVMLATPTGSTAYSVAAGGSMVHPNVPSILFTPICPHSLNFRPIILPDYVEVELRVPDNARCGAWVCFDGKQRQELSRGDAIKVKMSAHPLPTINKRDLTADWFESLERCFRWSDRMEQKPLCDSFERERAAAAAATMMDVSTLSSVDDFSGGGGRVGLSSNGSGSSSGSGSGDDAPSASAAASAAHANGNGNGNGAAAAGSSDDVDAVLKAQRQRALRP